ncbi:hypothetical protein EV361DRAFT_953602 [Lentinula raphanica]|nr:hypothetical protein EV361DRAFT_953602 [Lentinula raphanica]
MYQNMNGLRRADLVDLIWKIVVPGAKRAHRGVRDGMVKRNETKKDSKHKKPKEKLSMLRRNDLMGISSSGSQDQTSFVVQRLKDMRTLEEKNDLVRWAKESPSRNIPTFLLMSATVLLRWISRPRHTQK